MGVVMGFVKASPDWPRALLITLISAMVFVVVNPSRAADPSSARHVEWLPICIWPDMIPSPASEMAGAAEVTALYGQRDLARHALSLATASAIQDADLVNKLIGIACIAEVQQGLGWPEDAYDTLRNGVAAVQAHWNESQPPSVFTLTLRMLSIAHMYREAGRDAEAQRIIDFLSEKVRSSKPGLDEAFTTIKLSQFLQIWAEPRAADRAFDEARQIFLNVSTGENTAGSQNEGNTPPPALLLAMLAHEQAKVGRADQAIADFERTKLAGLPHSQELSESLIRMESVLEELLLASRSN